MKQRIHIYCEGIADQIFIADCLEIFYNIISNRSTLPKEKNENININFNEHSKIIAVNGCENFLKDSIFKDPAQDNLDEGGLNLVFSDADFPQKDAQKSKGNNGVINAHHKFKNIQKKVNFNYFLFPNNLTDGTLEDILLQLIPENNRPLLACFDQYSECLTNSGIVDLNYDIGNKRKISNYLHLLTGKTKEIERNYQDLRVWQLDCTISPHLHQIKQFLDKYFSSSEN